MKFSALGYISLIFTYHLRQTVYRDSVQLSSKKEFTDLVVLYVFCGF
jgi:hypothetical protein